VTFGLFVLKMRAHRKFTLSLESL